MKAMNRIIATLTVLCLMLFGAASAQEEQQQDEQDAQAQQQTTTRTVQIRGEEVAPLGEIEVGESRGLEQVETRTVEVEVQTGAIVINASTPEGESPNVDIVGPGGYFEHIEVSTDQEGGHVVNGLLPGVYSIAATDDGLQVAHTLVEVKPAEAISVNITLQALEAYQEGEFQPDTRTAFPDGAFETAEPQATENTEFGEVTVETENENTRFVITGPNNYSQEFTGTFTASDLAPGVYVIAGTIEDNYQIDGTLTGAQIATSAVAVNVSQAVTMVPVYDIVGAEAEQVEAETEQVEDVAGGGEGEQQDQQQTEGEQEQPEGEQQNQTEEQPEGEQQNQTEGQPEGEQQDEQPEGEQENQQEDEQQ